MNIGDVVRNRQTEQKMTVIERFDASLHCAWFDRKGELRKEWFDADQINLADSFDTHVRPLVGGPR